MKKIILCCFIAASQTLFAQNIDLADLEILVSGSSQDSIDNFLLTKGFQRVKIQGGAPTKGLQTKDGWRYTGTPNNDGIAVTMLGKFVDTSGKSFYRLQTTNPYFYSHLMNQLPQNNYSYKGTIGKEKEANMVFSNNTNEIIIRITQEFLVPYYYQINIGESVSDIGFFSPKKKAVASKRVTAKPKKKRLDSK